MRALPMCLVLLGMKCPDAETEGPPNDGEPPVELPPEGETIGPIDWEPYLDAIYQGNVTVVSGGPSGATGNTITSMTAGFSWRQNTDLVCAHVALDGHCFDRECAGYDPGTIVSFGAGVVSVAGLRVPNIELVETYEGFYPSFFDSNSESYYLPGQEVTAAASGGDVPAFDVTATAPDHNLEITEPPPGGATPTTVSADADLTYRWVPADFGNVTVALYALTGNPNTTRLIQCTQQGDAGELIVPLSKIPDLDFPAALESIRYTSNEITTAGDFVVMLELGSPLITADGALFTPRTLLFE